uniref:Uncharacterized protein n=1 Tax=Arundo donax TaxID=35708 RepID=A0A0A9DSJ7_ARUDO
MKERIPDKGSEKTYSGLSKISSELWPVPRAQEGKIQQQCKFL